MSKRGFTLIELLVVIAIIAILAAILFPVYARLKEKANQTTCLAQLKQLGLAFQSYANDYDGRLPRLDYPSGGLLNWAGCGQNCVMDLVISRGTIYPYVKSEAIYLCPTDAGKRLGGAPWGAVFQLSYTMNCYLDMALMDRVAKPSEMLLLIHQGRNTINGCCFRWTGSERPDAGHTGGTNTLMLDGHGKWFPYNALLATIEAGAPDWVYQPQ